MDLGLVFLFFFFRLQDLFIFCVFTYIFHKFLKIYLFLAVMGFRCCARAFSICDKRGLIFVEVHGLLIAVASLVAEHGL